MITDRLTARVLGLLLVALTLVIDVSCFVFRDPSIPRSAKFAVVVALPSLPLVALGVWLLVHASKLKPDDP